MSRNRPPTEPTTELVAEPGPETISPPPAPLAETNQPVGDTMPSAGETPPPAGETPPAPVELERLTPHQWGERLNLCEQADPARPWIESHADWRFAAADRLHGWTVNAHNHQRPDDPDRLVLTREDFDAALEAAAAYPEKPAHKAACAKGFEDRALTPKELAARAKEAGKATEVKPNG